MAAYLIEPHKLRLDYDARLEEAIQYACDNRIRIALWPVGEMLPKSCSRITEKLDITAIGEATPKWIVMDELEIVW